MKETYVDYETVEKEVERIYCDRCSSECTDKYRHFVGELCPECCDDYDGRLYETARLAKEAYEELPDQTMEPHVTDVITIGALAPIVFVYIMLNDHSWLLRGVALGIAGYAALLTAGVIWVMGP